MTGQIAKEWTGAMRAWGALAVPGVVVEMRRETRFPDGKTILGCKRSHASRFPACAILVRSVSSTP